MLAVDPIRYFSECFIEESRLLRFLYRPAEETLKFVINYAAETVAKAFELQLQGHNLAKLVPMPTDFRYFYLENAMLLQAGTLSAPSLVDWESQERSLIAKPQVLTAVEHYRVDDNFRMAFSIGRFGHYSIVYQRLFVESRLARAVQSGAGKWDYFDINTDDIINFFNPFPCIDEKQKAQ